MSKCWWIVMLGAAAMITGGCEEPQGAPSGGANPTPNAAVETRSWHTDLDLDAALARATEEHKVVVLGVFSLSGASGRAFEADVLQSPEAVALLRDFAVPVRTLPAEDTRARFAIRATPTILFLWPDGTEIDRIVGPLPLDEFVARARRHMEGWDYVTFAREGVIRAQVDLADVLNDRDEWGAAADVYFAALENCAAAPELGAEHGAAIVRQVLRLSRANDAVESEFTAWVERTQDAIEAGEFTAGEFELLAIALRAMGREDELLAVYDRAMAASDDAALLAACTDAILPLLVERDRLEVVGAHLDVAAAGHRAISRLELYAPSSDDYDSAEDWGAAVEAYRARVSNATVHYYAALMGLQQHAEAHAYVDRLVGFAKGTQILGTLARAGVASQHADEKTLELARQADESAQGVDVTISATLAHALAAVGNVDEALALLDKRIPLAGNENDRAVLEETRDEIAGEDAD